MAASAFASIARASSIQTFRLVNRSDQTYGHVDFNVIPPGEIDPPVTGTDPQTGAPVTGSPVAILAGSSGFDAAYFSVALASTADGSVQGMRMLFGQTPTVGADGSVSFVPTLGADGQPVKAFEPGAALNFSVAVSPDFQGELSLLLPASAIGLELSRYTPPSQPGTGSGGSGPNVPEPSAILVWVLGLAAILAIRGRVRRLA
jgi:hypothetical protein